MPNIFQKSETIAVGESTADPWDILLRVEKVLRDGLEPREGDALHFRTWIFHDHGVLHEPTVAEARAALDDANLTPEACHLEAAAKFSATVVNVWYRPSHGPRYEIAVLSETEVFTSGWVIQLSREIQALLAKSTPAPNPEVEKAMAAPAIDEVSIAQPPTAVRPLTQESVHQKPVQWHERPLLLVVLIPLVLVTLGALLEVFFTDWLG